MVNAWFHTDHTAFSSERTFCSTGEPGLAFPSEPTKEEVGNRYKDPVGFTPCTFRKLTEVPPPGTCYFMNLSSQMRNPFSAVSEEKWTALNVDFYPSFLPLSSTSLT